MTGYPGMRTCGELTTEGCEYWTSVSLSCQAAGSKLMGDNFGQVDNLEENGMMAKAASLVKSQVIRFIHPQAVWFNLNFIGKSKFK